MLYPDTLYTTWTSDVRTMPVTRVLHLNGTRGSRPHIVGAVGVLQGSSVVPHTSLSSSVWGSANGGWHGVDTKSSIELARRCSIEFVLAPACTMPPVSDDTSSGECRDQHSTRNAADDDTSNLSTVQTAGSLGRGWGLWQTAAVERPLVVVRATAVEG